MVYGDMYHIYDDTDANLRHHANFWCLSGALTQRNCCPAWGTFVTCGANSECYPLGDKPLAIDSNKRLLDLLLVERFKLLTRCI